LVVENPPPVSPSLIREGEGFFRRGANAPLKHPNKARVGRGVYRGYTFIGRALGGKKDLWGKGVGDRFQNRGRKSALKTVDSNRDKR
jgi:hypothetical protein